MDRDPDLPPAAHPTFEPITYKRDPDVKKALRWALGSGSPAGVKLEALARHTNLRAVPPDLMDEAVTEWEKAGCPEPPPGPWR